MAVKAKIGAGVWDLLHCEECEHSWTAEDINCEWTDEPEAGGIDCPHCHSHKVTREERG